MDDEGTKKHLLRVIESGHENTCDTDMMMTRRMPLRWQHYYRPDDSRLVGAALVYHQRRLVVCGLYLQALSRGAIFISLCWFVYKVARLFETDLHKKMILEQAKHVEKMVACADHYVRNQCIHAVPELVAKCAEWKTCIETDPALVVAVSGQSAVILADTLNAFIEHLTDRTLVCILVCVGAALYAVISVAA